MGEMNTKNYTKAWLSYHPVSQQYPVFRGVNCEVPHYTHRIVNACAEMERGLAELYPNAREGGMVTLKVAETDEQIHPEGYRLAITESEAVVTATTDRGLIYGVFALLRHLACEKPVPFTECKNPDNVLRMLNHWDNIDGSIERGYSGKSFYFVDDRLVISQRTRDFARLMASAGINAISVNNVNVRGNAVYLTQQEYRSQIKHLAEIFDGYGIALYLCVSFGAPMRVGGLSDADPKNPAVQKWWADMAQDLFTDVPSMGGFVIKADSEGTAGPFAYGCDQAEGANLLARALKPLGKTLIWRAFVYNCQQTWRDTKIDRARAAYDYFAGLDGRFEENVILQVKNGPMDFQVREPVHPLFGAMPNTNLMLEVQIAQEYTGQQRHVCYLLPQWKEVLEFRTYNGEEKDTVADIVGIGNGKRLGGIVGVSNTGDDPNWTGHDLAGANLYGFGRMCFDESLTSEEIAQEWIRLTLGNSEPVLKNVGDILMMSWPAYEKYNAPLGIGWMCNPSHHYGPNVDGYEYDRWGTYHRADWKGIGVDRSSHGTGYAALYHSPLKEQYETPETCPEELILFFHHLRYDYRLKSGKTVLQHIYDTHFEGVEDVDRMYELWTELKGMVDEDVYSRVLARMEHQKEHAREWRDVINTYFYRKTGIPDAQGRKIYE